MKMQFVLLIFLSFFSTILFAQTNFEQTLTNATECGSDIFQAELLENAPDLKKKAQEFEVFYQNYLQQRSMQTVEVLPVVFHLVHDGHAIGSDENPDDAVLIQRLNDATERFRHINQSNYSNPFSNADTEIEFCLADKDPNGNYTTGIVRHDDSLLFNNPNAELFNGIANYKWDTDKYLNLFLIDYIPGLLGVYYGGSTDVVVLRTGTSDWLIAHEVGHYLNLAHTFNGGCTNGDCLNDGDKVCDTPPKGFSGPGGSCSPPGNSCTTDADDTTTNNPYRPTNLGGMGDQPDMVENYLDYTEGCGGAFSLGQKMRMKAKIASDRQGLVGHSGLACGNNYTPSLEIALLDIDTDNDICRDNVNPMVLFQNNGSSTLTNAVLSFYLGGNLVHTQNWNGSLSTGNSIWVAATSPINLTEGRTKLKVELTLPNGSTDEFSNNNVTSRYVSFYLEGNALPYQEAFSAGVFPSEWVVNNTNMLWYMNGFSQLDACQSDNRLVGAAFSGGENKASIQLPPLDFSAYSTVVLNFDYGYLPNTASLVDTFRIDLIDSCGSPITVWEKFDLDLATNDPPSYTNGRNYPMCEDMDNLTIDLSAFACETNIALKFTISGWGRAFLILDKIKVEGLTPCVPDGCTYLIEPTIGGGTGVLPSSDIHWQALGGNITGYRLDVGLTSGGKELLNNVNVGNVDHYNMDGIFPCDTTIYVAIKPYDSQGNMQICPEESFQTMGILVCEPSFVEDNVESSFDAAFGVYAVDIDNDGDVDVLGISTYDMSWWENDGSENFTKHLIDNTFSGGVSVSGADVDGDGDIDIVGAAQVADEVAWWENDGSENFTKHSVVTGFGAANHAKAFDINQDGNIDIVASARNVGAIVAYLNDGSENFSSSVVGFVFGTQGFEITDVDEDGHYDVVGCGTSSDEVVWFKNSGNTSFTKIVVESNLDNPYDVGAGDLNGDGTSDFVAAILTGDEIVWYENDGNEQFTKHIIDDMIDSPSSVSLEDLDYDGDFDIIATGLGSENLVRYMNDGQGSFSKEAVISNVNDIYASYTVDIDGNGAVDIVIPQFFGDKIEWLSGSCFPPIITHLISPIHEAINVDINTTINWSAQSTAGGYYLTVGTSLGGEDILAYSDRGNTTSFTPAAPLPTNTTIYVSIFPYDNQGIVQSCAEENFQTQGQIVCTGEDIDFSSGTIGTGNYYSDGVVSAQNVSVQSGGEIGLYSNVDVILGVGFVAEIGTSFRAGIVNCNNNLNPPDSNEEFISKHIGDEFLKTKKLQLECYPNPTRGELNLTWQTKDDFEQLEISVRDINGKTIQTIRAEGSGNQNMKLNHMVEGIYFISLVGKNEVITRRIFLLK